MNDHRFFLKEKTVTEKYKFQILQCLSTSQLLKLFANNDNEHSLYEMNSERSEQIREYSLKKVGCRLEKDKR